MSWTTEERNAALQAWYEAKQKLDQAKESEMELRKKIVAESGMFDANKESGTENYDLGGGYKVKAVKKLTYKIENKQGEAFAVLSKLASYGETQAEIARNLFSFDANLRKAEFEKLRGEEKQLVESILTISQATPSLELITPDDK